jgi:hypothetical protein
MLVLPVVDDPDAAGGFVVRITTAGGGGAIQLSAADSAAVGRVLAPFGVDGAWLEGQIRSAFMAGRDRQRWLMEQAGNPPPGANEYVSGVLREVADVR